MRVFIITQDEPVYAPLYLDKVIRKSRHPVVGMTALSPAGHKGWMHLAKQRLKLYGPKDFLRAVSLYSFCRIRGYLPLRGSARRFYSVKQIATHYAIPLFPCTNVNRPAYLDTLKALDLDIVISIAAYQRFKTRLLHTPRLACLNVHSALLPKYRGLDGLFWALVHGETEVGVTVHLMDENFDSGAIVCQQPFAVAEDDTLHKLYLKAIDTGSTLLANALDAFAAGTVVPRPNAIESGSYFSAPTPEAVRQFRRNGKKFF